MSKRVLAVGLDPAVVDLTEFPGLTPAIITAYIQRNLSDCVDLVTTSRAVSWTWATPLRPQRHNIWLRVVSIV
jgi:hypothetical protein